MYPIESPNRGLMESTHKRQPVVSYFYPETGKSCAKRSSTKPFVLFRAIDEAQGIMLPQRLHERGQDSAFLYSLNVVHLFVPDKLFSVFKEPL